MGDRQILGCGGGVPDLARGKPKDIGYFQKGIAVSLGMVSVEISLPELFSICVRGIG